MMRRLSHARRCWRCLPVALPRLAPLTGRTAPGDAPSAHRRSPRGHRKIVFNWELDDRDMTGRGEGVARIASPDSARLDFFLAGGFGGGRRGPDRRFACELPGGDDLCARLVPPPTLLWAALGPRRVAKSAGYRHSCRGRDAARRHRPARGLAAHFRGRHARPRRTGDGGRVAEWIERSGSAHIRYRNEGVTPVVAAHRSPERMRFRSSMRRFGVLIASLLACSARRGCLYSFAGGGLPSHIRTMAIVTFDNQTPSPDIPKELYDEMRKELQRRLGVRDAPQERADAVVRGVISVLRCRRPGRLQRESAPGASRARRRLQLTIDIEIVDQSNGQRALRRTRRCAKRRTTPSAPSRRVGKQAIAKHRAEHRRRSAKQLVRSRRGAQHARLPVLICSSSPPLGYFGVNIGEVYWRFYQYQDDMRQEVRFAAHSTDDQILHASSRAGRFARPARGGGRDLDSPHADRRSSIESDYYEHIELPLFVREIHFNPHAEGPL